MQREGTPERAGGQRRIARELGEDAQIALRVGGRAIVAERLVGRERAFVRGTSTSQVTARHVQRRRSRLNFGLGTVVAELA